MNKKYALISVSDKTGLVEFARGLVDAGYEIISTGGTAKALSDNGIVTIPVEEITGFPECMDGRLKTIHPRIAGGLLGVRDKEEHRNTMEKHNIPEIDILAVNLYPFKETVSRADHTFNEAIENIDIGGPSMIRAAAKNYKHVMVVVDPSDYAGILHFAGEKGRLTDDYRLSLAAKAFRYTAAYDALIAEYLTKFGDHRFEETLTLTFRKHSDMRYGENPHQGAAYYMIDGQQGIENAEIIHGKALSYNNIADAHAAVALTQEFDEPVCVAVKHATPCGVAVGTSVAEAFRAAHECDPQSIFGGIVAFNREVDKSAAELMSAIFLEVIIAPSFSKESLEILEKKRDLRLLALPKFKNNPLEFKSVGGGLLIQDADLSNIENEKRVVVTKNAPTEEAEADLIFAMKVVKHVKSNAIVIAKNGRLLGQGGGEVSRIWAVEAALSRAGEQASGAVMASDAMLPFPDVVEICAEAGVTAIIQPGGSRNDEMSIEACDKHGIAMLFTGVRHFKH